MKTKEDFFREYIMEWKTSDFGSVNVKKYEQEKEYGELRQIYKTHNPGVTVIFGELQSGKNSLTP